MVTFGLNSNQFLQSTLKNPFHILLALSVNDQRCKAHIDSRLQESASCE